MAASPVYVGTPGVGVVNVVNADGTAQKTVVTAGSSGTKVVSLTATSNDTGAKVFQVAIVRSATTYILGTVSVPTLAGTDGSTPSVNILGNSLLPGLPIDNDGQSYIFIKSGDTLVVQATTAVTATKTVTFTSVYGDF
jgi:hypothetical protein